MFAPITLLTLALQGIVPVAVPPVAAPLVPETAVSAAPGTATPSSVLKLDRADSLLFADRLPAAQSLYKSLAERQSSSGHYAKQALWDLAMADRTADQPFRMVTTLDELASAARRYGDPEMELVASYEAARYYAAMKQPVVSRDRLDRVRALLQSPVISPAIKADYAARLRSIG
jgi:hypothetical protein